jgi:hypothetical protein
VLAHLGWLQNFASRMPAYGGKKGGRGGNKFGGRDVRKEFGGEQLGLGLCLCACLLCSKVCWKGLLLNT